MSAQRQRKKNREPRQHRWRPYYPFLVGALLLAASWALARWAPVRRAPEIDLEEVSVGLNFLVAGAFPWGIQLVGIAVLFLGVSRFIHAFDTRCVVMGAIVPLLVGTVWWTSLIAIYWDDNPLEAMGGMLELSVLQQYGAESMAQGLLHDVIGPLTGPFMLRGPYSMEGWAFLKAALSTAAVMAIWIAVAKVTRGLEDTGKLRRGQWILCAILLILWLLPVVIRTTIRVTRAFQHNKPPVACVGRSRSPSGISQPNLPLQHHESLLIVRHATYRRKPHDPDRMLPDCLASHLSDWSQ